MDPEQEEPASERDHTNASLNAERKNADEALAQSLEDVEADAAQLLERARKNADEVLALARSRAAERIDEDDSESDEQPRELAHLHAKEDEVLRKERATADAVHRREAIEQRRVLAALLPLERQKTDRNLITERERADDAVARRDDFLGIVSHDLRNLLSGIVLNSNVIAATARDVESADRTIAGMQRIQRYAARMSRLIDDLVDVASIDSGKLHISGETADAAALLTEAVESFALAAADSGITLNLDIGSDPLPAWFDHDRMLQVLANLITNALKFTPRGGRIVVQGERGPNDLCLRVADTGCGIEARLLDVVFERFWQSGKHDRRGLGLGLYISKCIVEAHGGHITVRSEPGKGSEFRVDIPAIERRPTPESSPPLR